jgi:hypothetical protein
LSAGLRMTMAENSWPPSHAPPPGDTFCSMIAMRASGAILDSSYAHDRPAEPVACVRGWFGWSVEWLVGGVWCGVWGRCADGVRHNGCGARLARPGA